ncbi:hypothetical protein GQ43DRAFT_67311 [Delitschia confertaspora ATCC 74209]|uniref:Uncharacterized protein n=1 Tax=Delitschia confertaspora ATCC 74209 TaxID=1513339 RepID=A0A9P4JTW9_9PLEO|nr:hypothetical protein GQ43DRAFT_67311 [Delitschia confertaspora ATCC 74209]
MKSLRAIVPSDLIHNNTSPFVLAPIYSSQSRPSQTKRPECIKSIHTRQNSQIIKARRNWPPFRIRRSRSLRTHILLLSLHALVMRLHAVIVPRVALASLSAAHRGARERLPLDC